MRLRTLRNERKVVLEDKHTLWEKVFHGLLRKFEFCTLQLQHVGRQRIMTSFRNTSAAPWQSAIHGCNFGKNFEKVCVLLMRLFIRCVPTVSGKKLGRRVSGVCCSIVLFDCQELNVKSIPIINSNFVRWISV